MTRLCLVVEDESPLGEMICDNLQNEGFGTEGDHGQRDYESHPIQRFPH